jgi:AmmeMemoRadiSam system protein B
MSDSHVRPMAVAGSWYPRTAGALAEALDHDLRQADAGPAGDVRAIIAPHAGLMYSGPVAAYAYRAAAAHAYDVVVLVGPSHFTGFDGVALWDEGRFETPLGPLTIDAVCAQALVAESPVIIPRIDVHGREHSLEMQLPFLRHLLPSVPIVPLLMGFQTPETILALGEALARALEGRRALLVASSDLSHYQNAATAWRLDRVVLDAIVRFEPMALLDELEREPTHACGGGPMVSVMSAARKLGADDAIVLKYGDSGDVSGDKSAVVGYVAAALGNFT